MSHPKHWRFIGAAACAVAAFGTAGAASAAGSPSVGGKILLQVESRGEAWYVDPKDGKRHSLGSPEAAIQVFSRIGVGIADSDLSRIPVGFAPSGKMFGVSASGETDRDADDIPDEYEVALGTDPASADTDADGYADIFELRSGHDPLRGNGAKLPLPDAALRSRMKGKIVLQVGSRGQAWYVNPSDGRRYYLGTPQRALAGMRAFGLGITNANLARIPLASAPAPSAAQASASAFDCNAGMDEEKAAACVEERFKSCLPTKYRVEIDFGAMFGGVVGYAYEILGPQGQGCRARSRFTKHPNPAFLNKEMVCDYDRTMSFEDAVEDASPKFEACSGELKTEFERALTPSS